MVGYLPRRYSLNNGPVYAGSARIFMAQPKNRRPPPGKEEDKERAARRVEFENLEKKADAIVQKRNEFNAQARAAREERDLLHNKRKEVYEAMQKAKAERDALNKQLHAAKDLRGQFQAQAKELIAKKKARFKKEAPQAARHPGLLAQELLAEINDLDFAQQTTVLSVAQENELIKQLRMKKGQYEKVRKEAEKAAKIKVDLTDIDKAIDELFGKAEEQHKIVLEFYKKSQAAHDEFVKHVNEVATAQAEANKHHKRHIEMREKADAEHKQFLELREKMLELKGREFADRREAREIIKEQRQRVRRSVSDPEGLNKIAEESLDVLKKGGKIRLGS